MELLLLQKHLEIVYNPFNVVEIWRKSNDQFSVGGPLIWLIELRESFEKGNANWRDYRWNQSNSDLNSAYEVQRRKMVVWKHSLPKKKSSEFWAASPPVQENNICILGSK